MSPQEIYELFHQTIELEASKRDSFLEAACAGDEAALLYIKSLVKHHQEGILSSRVMDNIVGELVAELSLQSSTEPDSLESSRIALIPGQRLYRYEILEKVGEGTMGQVYRARDIEIGDTVAIKVLSPDFSDRPDFEDLRDRFKHEVQILRKVKHPNVCTLYDIRHDDGLDYLVMQYVESGTLRKRLEQPLSIPEFMEIAEQCLEALKEVHGKKVLHRDIKPENIMFDAGGV